MATYRVPKNDLDPSIEVARKCHDEGGEVSADALAAFLGYKSANNGAYLNRVAAARMFGLVEGQSPRIKATPLALQIVAPGYDHDEITGRLKAFNAIPLFRDFLRDNGGKPLPKKQGIDNILKNQYGIQDAQAGFARARLLRSAEQAGLFRVASDRMIVPPASQGGAEEPDGGEGASEEPPPPSTGNRSKLVEGALDMLPPPGTSWDEDGLQDFITLLEVNLRAAYKLPLRRKGGE